MLPAAQPVSSKLWGPRFCLIFSEKRWEPLHVMPARESVISAYFSEGLGTRRRRPLTQTKGRRGVRKGNCGLEGRGEGKERGGGEGREEREEREEREREEREEREERREPFCSRASKSSKPAALEMCASLM